MANNTKNRKAILVTPEVCIGCRGCQTACKSWNQLPGIKTKNNGTFQNPPDLASAAYNIIRYSEVPSDRTSTYAGSLSAGGACTARMRDA